MAMGTRRPRTLYHFTCRLWWRFIETEGINRGDTPASTIGAKGLNLPNLTTDPEPRKQGWAGDPRKSASNKRAVRITVDVPPEDPRLFRWIDLVRQHGMDQRTLGALDPTGDGARNWWIFNGVVEPRYFRAVDYFDGGKISEQEREMIETSRPFTASADFLRSGPFSVVTVEEAARLVKEGRLRS